MLLNSQPKYDPSRFANHVGNQSNRPSSRHMSGIEHTHFSLFSNIQSTILGLLIVRLPTMGYSTHLFSELTSTSLASVKLPNGITIHFIHMETMYLMDIVLADVLCVSSFSFNLISVSKLTNIISVAT